MAKKDKLNGPPDYEEQKQMRLEIIGRLDSIILNWNPKFVVDRTENGKYSELSHAILNKLKSARDTLNDLFLPRQDRRITDCYNIITERLDVIGGDAMSSYGGEKILEDAADKIAQAVEQWKNLR